MIKNLLRWFIFGVLLALVPLVASAFDELTKGTFLLINVLSHGELLLITVGICGSSIGGLIGSKPFKDNLKVITGGGALIIAILASLYFANISNSVDISDPQIIQSTSLSLFFSGLITSGVNIALSGDS